ncbi:uncharacterized protein LOC129948410 [Eupeodes corollae]|uniref:uncharacterized protein LOC129948410 n=1 Tax=Eupeodes corollae TaxID=290404 RepID=UPI0024914224|nr:uncharacterized protein LOC129948410 [Eupeodes corollae]
MIRVNSIQWALSTHQRKKPACNGLWGTTQAEDFGNTRTTYFSSEAIKLAITSSFNGRINLLYTNIRTNFNENNFIFTDMLDNILEEKWAFQLQIDVNNEGYQAVGDYNLWFIDSFESFTFLEPMIRDHGGDAPVYYLVFLKTPKTDLNLVEKLLADMALLNVVNVNIVIEDNASNEVIFYTYFPFRATQCHSTEPLELLRFHNFSKITPQGFYPTKADNLQRCTLKIVTRNPTFFRGVKQYYGLPEVGGLEIALIDEFSRRMNFTIQLIERFIYEKVLFLENGTSFGGYKLIQENEADIMIGFHKHGPLQDHYVTPSQTYFFNWVAIALWRPPYTFRKFSWLFIPFQVKTWGWCLAVLISATIGVFIVKKMPFLVRFLHLNLYRSKLTNVASMALGLSIEYLPTTNFVRQCFVIWSIGTLTIRATYEGKLFDSYRSLTGAGTPLTVRQLLAQNYTIYSQFTYAFVLNELGGIGSFSYQRLPTTKVLSNRTQNNAVISSFVYMYEVYDPEELENMIIEPLFYEHVCLFMKKHSVLASKVNDIIFRMEEAGLFNSWREHYEFLKTIHFSLHKDNVREPGPIALNQFIYTLLMFAIPIGVAIVVFIIELNWKEIQHKLAEIKLRC